MKRQHVFAAAFVLAAAVVWIAETLWLRRALDAEQDDELTDAQREGAAEQRLVQARSGT